MLAVTRIDTLGMGQESYEQDEWEDEQWQHYEEWQREKREEWAQATKKLQECAENPSAGGWYCAEAALALTDADPRSRAVLEALDKILARDPYLGMNSLETPQKVLDAFRHHAPVELSRAANTLSRLLEQELAGRSPLMMSGFSLDVVDMLREVLVSEPLPGYPAAGPNERARAILVLNKLADRYGEPNSWEEVLADAARGALAEVGHRTAAPIPVVKPTWKVEIGPAEIEEIVAPPTAPPTAPPVAPPVARQTTVIAIAIGATAVFGLVVALAAKERHTRLSPAPG